MIYVGIDDTDTLDSRGTNQLARQLAESLPPGFTVLSIIRHQLLFDPRIPYTSKNGSASLAVHAEPGIDTTLLIAALRDGMLARFEPGSDPGLCVAESVPPEVIAFARRCQREPVRQQDAHDVARAAGIHLEGLGGTQDGVIGALAAVGLLATGQDGRVVHLRGWIWPDPFRGVQPVRAILDRGIAEIIDAESGHPVIDGLVDVGKHLRPAYRHGRAVLLVARAGSGADWKAIKPV